MIRAFTYFALWMKEHAMVPRDYEIVVRPRTFDAYQRLLGAMKRDAVDLHFYPVGIKPFTEGSIAGLPFRIVRVPL